MRPEGRIIGRKSHRRFLSGPSSLRCQCRARRKQIQGRNRDCLSLASAARDHGWPAPRYQPWSHVERRHDEPLDDPELRRQRSGTTTSSRIISSRPYFWNAAAYFCAAPRGSSPSTMCEPSNGGIGSRLNSARKMLIADEIDQSCQRQECHRACSAAGRRAIGLQQKPERNRADCRHDEVRARPGRRAPPSSQKRGLRSRRAFTGTGLAQPNTGRPASASPPGSSTVPDRIDVAQRVQAEPAGAPARSDRPAAWRHSRARPRETRPRSPAARSTRARCRAFRPWGIR